MGRISIIQIGSQMMIIIHLIHLIISIGNPQPIAVNITNKHILAISISISINISISMGNIILISLSISRTMLSSHYININ